MNYNVLVLGNNEISQMISEISTDIEEKIIIHTIAVDEFELKKIKNLSIDIIVISSYTFNEIILIVNLIREHYSYKITPILLISNDKIEKLFKKIRSYGAIDTIVYPFDKQSFYDRFCFNLNLSYALKRIQGENKIIKNKLVELERLRANNDVLFNSTQTLEDLNQELEKQRDEIEKQKQQIEIEKMKSEELLKNILPEETSRELIIHGEAKTQFYKKVSVLFSDFQGFTTACENMHPQEIVRELDKHFTKFEEICETLYVEKIKTIGDAYMCAGGIPMRNNSNPVDVVLVGLGILRYMNYINVDKQLNGLRTWDVRVGIHTGSLIAGVIGKKKFAYDIWGDTVNTASRMETSGEANKLNISGDTYEFVKHFFNCEYRGKIEAKNKGLIDMYFVLGIKPELSEKGEGILPNKEFISEYSKL